MGCVKENKTVKDILGYEIGDEVWFIASMSEAMALNLEYADRLVEGTNTTYRFISIPTKGLIESIYITKRSQISDNNPTPSFINVGGTRFKTNDVEEISRCYNPKTDLINFEISAEFSPGAVDRRYPSMSFGQYDVRSNASIGPFPEVLVSMCKPFFASGIVTVYSDFVGSTPEEAESNFIGIQQKMANVYRILQYTGYGSSSAMFNGYSIRL